MILKKLDCSIFLILITNLFFNTAISAKEGNDASRTNYQSSVAKSAAQSFTLADLVVNIAESYVEQKESMSDTNNEASLRAKITVEKDGKTIDKLTFDHMQDQGYLAGLFLPKPQPLPNYFLILKHGDYDGHLLIIGKNGQINDIGGGSYFITDDKHYIFSNYEEDTMGTGFTVFDLQNNRIVFKTSKKDTAWFDNIKQWYKDESGYFFTVTSANERNQLQPKNGWIFAYQFASNRLLREAAENRLKKAKKIQLVSLDTKDFAVLAP